MLVSPLIPIINIHQAERCNVFKCYNFSSTDRKISVRWIQLRIGIIGEPLLIRILYVMEIFSSLITIQNEFRCKLLILFSVLSDIHYTETSYKSVA